MIQPLPVDAAVGRSIVGLEDGTMSEHLEQRLVDLELRYMRAEKMLQDLSDVLVGQQKTIVRLAAELTALRERVPVEAGDLVPIEPPPHY
jgi:uncharacterized coiled-coil protein SlyX